MCEGYGRFGGTKTAAHDLNTLFSSLEANALISQHRLLTG